MRILDFLLRSEYTKSIFKLTTGSVLAQGITFLFMLVLTRIYSPSDFGLFTLYLSILAFIAIVSTGKYDVAVVVSKKFPDAIALVKIASVISFGVAFLTILFVLINFFLPQGIYSDHPINSWLLLIPVSVILVSLVQIFWMWNVRQKQYSILNYSRISDAFSAGFIPVVLSFMGAIGLLIGHIIGQLVSLVIVAFNFFRKDFKTEKTTNAGLVETARKYSEFPKVNIFQGFIDTFQTMGVVLIGSKFLSIAEIGFYSLSLRILQVPMGLVIKPVSHIFFSEASEIKRADGNIYELVLQTIKKTAIIVLPVTLTILIFGPLLFSVFFGEEWREAGVYAQILSVWFFFDLIRAPIAQVGSVLGKQRKILWITFISFVVLLITLIAGGFLFSDNVYLLLAIISGSQSVILVFMIWYILRMAKEKST